MDFFMDADQQEAVRIAVAGHNLALTGPPGTGKSFVIKKIVDSLQGKSVAVSASTGIAALNLARYGLQAQTIHSLTGKCSLYRFFWWLGFPISSKQAWHATDSLCLIVL